MAFFLNDPQKFVKEIKFVEDFAKINATLRFCVTEKCNLHCTYCHREGMDQFYNNPLTKEDYEFIAKTFFDLGFKKVKFTGGEPLLKEDICKIVNVFKKSGFLDVSLVTNGVLLNELILKELKEAGLDRITISLDTLNKKAAKELSSCNVDSVLDNVPLARKYFDNIKINCVVLPKVNFPEEMLDIANFCRDNNVTLKILSRLDEESPFPLSNQTINIIKLYKQLTKKELSAVSAVPSMKYTFSDGTIIEINDFRSEEYRKKMNTFAYCDNCTYKAHCIEGPYAIRILPNGDIKPCLIRSDNIVQFRKAQKSPVKVICLTGLASAGKSSFRELAEENFNIKGVYIGKILKESVKNKGLPVTYENVMELSKQIYLEEGPLGVVTKSFDYIEKQLSGQKVIVIDSIRSVEEYTFLSQLFKVYLVGVICSKEERFKRAKVGDFKLTTEQLIERDKVEMGETNSSPRFNVGELLGHADYYISRESKDFEEKTIKIIKAIIDD